MACGRERKPGGWQRNLSAARGVGGRVAASDAADPRSVSRWSVPTLDGCVDLSEVAARLRAAAEVEALAADGWLAERVGDSDVELRDAVFDV